MNRVRGFSLVEVLLACTLLAAGIALGFAALRGATRATETASQLADRGERLRAVQGFLRRQVEAAMPLPMVPRKGVDPPRVFEADGMHLRLVAPMPGYLSRGGPYVQQFTLVRGTEGLRLEFQHQLLTPDGPIDPERPAEVLLDGIDEARFEMRELDEEGRPGPWQATWDANDRLPALVRLTVRMRDRRDRFPRLVAAPRLAHELSAYSVLPIDQDGTSVGTPSSPDPSDDSRDEHRQ